MKIEFIGAAHEVTGSCHYVECGNTKLIIDYGLEQGINYFKNVPLPVSPEKLDYILITHAHIDHTGRLPILLKEGFKGTILCTEATKDLLGIMLKDSANLAMQNAEHKNKHLPQGMKPVQPIFTMADVEKVISSVTGISYSQMHDLGDGIKIRFNDAGHLLGSSCIEMFLTENGVNRKLVFSGDIGNTKKPIIRDPQYITEADYVVTEATYADRIHEFNEDFVEALAAVIQHTFDKGGNVVIPAFAVGRTQEMLYYMALIKSDGLVSGHDNFEVWVDSPMAVSATKVFNKNLLECYDDQTRELVENGIDPIGFEDLRMAVTREDSIRLNDMDYPKVIISSSGMCDAGRIRHHLKHNLGRAESSIIFAGYQAVGTLGRRILEGAPEVNINGDIIPVNAKIVSLTNMSSHADKNGLIKWISEFRRAEFKKTESIESIFTEPEFTGSEFNKIYASAQGQASAKDNDTDGINCEASGYLKKVFVVHSDDQVAEGYCKLLKDELGIDAEAPFSGSIYDLAQGLWLHKAEGIPLTHTRQQLEDYDVYVRETQ